MRILVGLMLMGLVVSGCAPYWQLQEGRLAKAKAGLIEDYRACLKGSIGKPDAQRECAAYNQALIQLDVKGLN